jgi:hypothetical protein
MAGRRASRARIRWLDSPADDPWPHTGSRSRPRVADRRSTRCVPMSTGRLVLGVEALRCGSSSPSRSTGRRAVGVCGGAAQGLMRGARCHAGISSRSPDSRTSAPRPAGTPGRCSVRGATATCAHGCSSRSGHGRGALPAHEFLRPLREGCPGTSHRHRRQLEPPGVGLFRHGQPHGSSGNRAGRRPHRPAPDRPRGARSVPRCAFDVATAR